MFGPDILKNLFKNQTFLTITGADFFETIGISLFNIILLTYAKTFVHANFWVSIVSIASIIPGIFGFITGHFADKSQNKRFWLVFTKFLQALLYILLAQLINHQHAILLLIIILINIISDIMGVFSTGLRMPIIQNKIPGNQREQAIGINQGIATLMAIIGQALGVGLLTITHDYQLAGYINALTFIISGIILLLGYNNLQTVSTKEVHRDFKQLCQQIKLALEAGSQINAGNLVGSVLLMNAVGASLDSIITLFLVDHEHQLPLPFGICLVVINTAYVLGSISGNILHNAWLKKLSFQTIMMLSVISIILLYSNLLSIDNFWVIPLMMMISGFAVGQANPKLMAGLLKVADKDIVGSLSGLISSIAVIAVPIGSIGLVLIYNIVSPNMAYIVSIILLVVCAMFLLWPHQIRE